MSDRESRSIEESRLRYENNMLRQEVEENRRLLGAGLGLGVTMLLFARTFGGSGSNSSFDTSSREAFMSECLSSDEHSGDMAGCSELWQSVG